tara:strand:+ start:501 stop:653 length:153 start_codon:yes stop_codon:yes gene_type:complete
MSYGKENKKGVASKKNKSKPMSKSYGKVTKPKMVLRKKKKIKEEGGSGNY